jgi:hypothetical protein
MASWGKGSGGSWGSNDPPPPPPPTAGRSGDVGSPPNADPGRGGPYSSVDDKYVTYDDILALFAMYGFTDLQSIQFASANAVGERGTELPQDRIKRLVQEIQSGQKSFYEVARSISRLHHWDIVGGQFVDEGITNNAAPPTSLGEFRQMAGLLKPGPPPPNAPPPPAGGDVGTDTSPSKDSGSSVAVAAVGGQSEQAQPQGWWLAQIQSVVDSQYAIVLLAGDSATLKVPVYSAGVFAANQTVYIEFGDNGRMLVHQIL